MLEAILTSKQLYEGPRMVKPPTVFVAGMLRARKRGITTNAWSWVLPGAGQRLYYPPDVAGWDDKRWLDTNTTLGRWEAVIYALEDDTEEPGSDDYPDESAAQALAKARDFWGAPTLTSARRRGPRHLRAAGDPAPTPRRGCARSARTRCGS